MAEMVNVAQTQMTFFFDSKEEEEILGHFQQHKAANLSFHRPVLLVCLCIFHRCFHPPIDRQIQSLACRGTGVDIDCLIIVRKVVLLTL